MAVLGASTMATVQFLILAGVGAVAAIRPKAGPLLSPEKVSFLARLANDVFMPCWTMATIGAQVDLAQLRKDWAIVILGFLTVFLGFAIADLTALFFRPTQSMIPAMRVSIAQVNALAVPLVLLGSLCESRRVNDAFDEDSGDCKDDAAGKLNVFMVAWHATFWSYGFATLEATAKEAESTTKALAILRRTAVQPNVVALFVGLFLALTPLGTALFRNKRPTPLRPVGAALQVLGSPMLATVVLIMAAALVHGRIRTTRKQIQDGVTEDRTTELVVHSVSDADQAAEEKVDERRQPPDDRRLATLLWFVLARLFFVPLIGYGLAFALRRRSFGLSKLARLVVLVEFAAPSAQTILTVLYALGLGRVAEGLAPFYFVQYLVSILTMTAFGAFALFIIYHAD